MEGGVILANLIYFGRAKLLRAFLVNLQQLAAKQTVNQAVKQTVKRAVKQAVKRAVKQAVKQTAK